jgi:hypothetical protein
MVTFLESLGALESLGSKVEGERSNKKPHLFIVNKVITITGDHGVEWALEGFVIRGYSFSDDPIQYVEEYNTLIPLPPPPLTSSPANSSSLWPSSTRPDDTERIFLGQSRLSPS